MPAAAPLVLRIDALLPQTQCGRCGYPTCREYAEAVADGRSDINRCAPGGSAGIAALAALLGRAAKPLDPACGSERAPQLAVIDEEVCIGCTKCIQACPVDAIIGSAKHMHTVLADQCTGCELCVPACPVDCIALLDAGAAPLPRPALLARAEQARARFEARTLRLAVAAETSLRPAHAGIARPPPTQAAPTNPAPAGPGPVAPLSHAAVLEAIARGRARKAARQGGAAPDGKPR